MHRAMPSKEGFLSFRDHKVWYRVVGDGEGAGQYPLLCLHGGPGVPHDHLEPMEVMAATGRRVIFYDQLGCGNSDQPHDPSLWTVGLFVDEVGVVREALGLDRIHLLGHSWGGMLAMEYALTQPAGLVSLTLAGPLASAVQYASEGDRLRAELPPEVQQTLLEHEDAGTTDDPAYEEAMMVYYGRHLCRLDPWPDYLVRALEKSGQNPEVYHTMWGPSELHMIGSLKDWDIAGRLGEIHLPTLVISGRYDVITPAVAQTVHQGIQESEWVLFEQSSHFYYAEEPEKYFRVLGQFLSRVEAQA